LDRAKPVDHPANEADQNCSSRSSRRQPARQSSGIDAAAKKEEIRRVKQLNQLNGLKKHDVDGFIQKKLRRL
jgi:hypothetical protein